MQTNGWTAADEFELIMRRWRATLDRGKMGEITVGKRKLSRRVQKALPAQEVLARAHAVSGRRGHLECHRRAAQPRSRAQCSDGVHGPRQQQARCGAEGADAAARRWPRRPSRCGRRHRSCNQPVPLLSTCDRSRRGSAEPWTEQEDRQLLHAFWISLEVPTAPLKSAMIMSVSSRLRSENSVKLRLNQLRSRLPPHVAEQALPSRQKQLQTSRWLELAERCCNPQTRPSGPQQNDAAVAKAARAAIADDENLDDAGKQALRRAAGRAPLQRLPLSGLAANHTVPPMRIEEGSVVPLQQRDGKRIDHGRVPTAAQYGPSARQVRIPEKWHLRINDTRFFLLDANSDLARLRGTQRTTCSTSRVAPRSPTSSPT